MTREELAGLGLLAREVDPGPPVAVRYALTGSGAALAPTLGALTEWAGTHLPADRCSEDGPSPRITPARHRNGDGPASG